MDRRTVYRRRAAPSARYRRPRLVETASVRRYPAAAEAAYTDQPQTRAPSTAAQSFAEGSATAAADQGEQSGDTRQDKTRQDQTRQDKSSQPVRNAVADASTASAADTFSDQAAVEPRAESSSNTRSEPDVASLVIPRGAMPAPLKGSLASLQRQNDRLAAEGLERILDEDDLAARIANRLLVPLPASDALTVNPSLTVNHRYCRPWTARFLADLARDHDAVFHRPLEVSSAVRTVAYQKRLMGINGNAAPAEGDVVSPHLTGATIDIAKEGLTRDEMKWMRSRLLQIEKQGKIDVEEEFQQSCFHITVYQTYAPPHTRRRVVHPEPVEAAAGPAAEGL
jgi:hypothetical protein